MTGLLLFVASATLGQAALPAWDFNDTSLPPGWQANSFLADVRIENGVLSGRTTDWDPFFTIDGIEFPATPWQYVAIRIKADQSGECDLFWTGSLEGQYGGLSEQKKTHFNVPGDNEWHEIVAFPFWQAEGTIKRMRFDLYADLNFAIDYVRIGEWGAGQAPITGQYEWTFPEGDASAWRVSTGAAELVAPPLDLDIAGRGYIVAEVKATQPGQGQALWAAPNAPGAQSEGFEIIGDGKPRRYNIEVQSYPTWKDRISALGVRLPAAAQLLSLAVSETPLGPPQPRITYFGLENGAPRAGAEARVLAHIENHGGSAGDPLTVTVQPGPGLEVASVPEQVESPDLGEYTDLVFNARAAQPGTFPIHIALATASGDACAADADLEFLPQVTIAPAGYVPEPVPVKTGLDVLAYYFPGWCADEKWDCVRRVAPNRKPLLGYYDEANPECVDWQIKWAVENGVTGFLVDWYWLKGNQHLVHWFDAYRKARYRDQLKVAIMWANHNPPNSHTREDWRTVTQHWIDNYFNLPGYYRVEEKPAVFIWNPPLIRSDLGGSKAVREAFDESQAMARAAGYEGITFITVNGCNSEAEVPALIEEGYHGRTNYHEWGDAVAMAPSPNRMLFGDVVKTAAAAWKRRDAMSAELVYYPLVDSGWDSRPWHGNKAQVFSGRTVPFFEDLLRQAKEYCLANSKPFVVIGPVNEWGEGSYIEPCTEYGFGMMEAVRNVFAKGDPSSWPVNVGPADLGLGPYDFPPALPTTAWTFDDGPQGWSAMMNVSALTNADGALEFTTTTNDPAITTSTRGLLARKFSRLKLELALSGQGAGNQHAALFWSSGGGAVTEATCVAFPVATNAGPQTCEVDLSVNPRWRGRITTLRFDPCNVPDVRVRILSMEFLP